MECEESLSCDHRQLGNHLQRVNRSSVLRLAAVGPYFAAGPLSHCYRCHQLGETRLHQWRNTKRQWQKRAKNSTKQKKRKKKNTINVLLLLLLLLKNKVKNKQTKELTRLPLLKPMVVVEPLEIMLQ